MTRPLSITLTRTNDDTGAETELDVAVVPVDPPCRADGVTAWGFECIALAPDGAEVALTSREQDWCCGRAAEMLRRRWRSWRDGRKQGNHEPYLLSRTI